MSETAGSVPGRLRKDVKALPAAYSLSVSLGEMCTSVRKFLVHRFEPSVYSSLAGIDLLTPAQGHMMTDQSL